MKHLIRKILTGTLIVVSSLLVSITLNIIILSAQAIFEFERGIATGLPSPSSTIGNPITILSQEQIKGTIEAEPYRLTDPPANPAGSIAATRFEHHPDNQYYFDLDGESKINGLCMQDGRQIDDAANTECGTVSIRYVSETDNDLNRIENVACPVDDQDAATKAYVDNIVAGRSGCDL